MEAMAEALKNLKLTGESKTVWTYEQMLQNRCDVYNSKSGALDGVDCPICKNKGSVMEIINGYVTTRECRCMAARKSLWRIERSGLRDVVDLYTLENYETREPWQGKVMETAKRFLADEEARWWYFGGQVGAGKTHICTAITTELMRRGMAAKYMLWRDEVVQLKACITDDQQYNAIISPLKTAPVLYIDDLFKVEKGKSPSAADVNIAFELLNYRYNNRELYTIISSEKAMNDLLDIDEAVGSRVYERTKAGGYQLSLSPDKSKNYRLK